MKALIVEDEKAAQDFLMRMIQTIDPSIKVIGCADSVESAVEWLSENKQPDIAFFDIQLADGLSFEIFERFNVECPVIFTTAYEEYAIRAFKVNSIDYLLKPIDPKLLAKAFEKYRNLKGDNREFKSNEISLKINQMMDMLNNKHKERFLISIGDKYKIINTSEVVCFYSFDKSTFIVDSKGKQYALDYSLDKLEDLVSPIQFFRIDRKYLVNKNFISEIYTFSSSRLKVKLVNFTDDDMLVSRKRVAEFKKWLEN